MDGGEDGGPPSPGSVPLPDPTKRVSVSNE